MAKKQASGGGRARQSRAAARTVAQPPAVSSAPASPGAAAAPLNSAAETTRAPAPRASEALVGAAAAGPLSLGASLSICEVGERAAQLRARFAAGSAEVDVGMLESVDTAGLQLLLAAAVGARRRGLKLKLLGAERLNTGAARALGLAEHLAAAAEILP
ncbi:MAG: STAS domain-containing protein [Steroidobacterales bacterium]